MKTVYYIGPHPAVEVPAAGAVAANNEPFEVSDELAGSLLEQSDLWASKPVTGPGSAVATSKPERKPTSAGTGRKIKE